MQMAPDMTTTPRTATCNRCRGTCDLEAAIDAGAGHARCPQCGSRLDGVEVLAQRVEIASAECARDVEALKSTLDRIEIEARQAHEDFRAALRACIAELDRVLARSRGDA